MITPFRSIALFYFFYFAFIGINVVFMPKLFFDLGYTPAQIGVIYAILPLVRFATPLILTRIIPLTSAVYRQALVLTVISTLAMALSIRLYPLLLVATAVWSVAWSITLPFVDAKALSVMSKQTYGRVRLFGSLGFIATTLLIGMIVQSLVFELTLLVLCAVMTALFGWLLLDEHDHETDRRQKEERTHAIDLARHWPFWTSMFLMQVAFGAYYNFFTIFASQHGYAATTISYMWTFGVMCEIAMLYFQGPLFRFSLLSLIMVSTVLTALRWIVIAIVPDNMTLMILAQGLHSVGFALYHTATISYLFELYPDRRVAQQFYYGISFGLGGFLGALLFGWLYGPWVFVYAGLTTLAAAAVLVRQYGRDTVKRG